MRRTFLSLLIGFPGLGLAAAAQAKPKMKVLIKSAWGSKYPTQAAFPFHHANAFADGGHDVQSSGRKGRDGRSQVVANAVSPVGWPRCRKPSPPRRQKIPSQACGACARACGAEADPAGKNATFANPAVFVGLVEWADKVLTE